MNARGAISISPVSIFLNFFQNQTNRKVRHRVVSDMGQLSPSCLLKKT